MPPVVLLAIIVAIPVLVAVLFRVNAAMLFMSLCVGEVFIQYMSSNVVDFMNTISPSTGHVSETTARLILLLAPSVLTIIFMFHSVHGGIRNIVNGIVAVTVGLLLAFLVAPLLSPGMQKTLESSTFWHQILQAQTLIVGAGALASLLFLWSQHYGGHKQHKAHSSKKH